MERAVTRAEGRGLRLGHRFSGRPPGRSQADGEGCLQCPIGCPVPGAGVAGAAATLHRSFTLEVVAHASSNELNHASTCRAWASRSSQNDAPPRVHAT